MEKTDKETVLFAITLLQCDNIKCYRGEGLENKYFILTDRLPLYMYAELCEKVLINEEYTCVFQ